MIRQLRHVTNESAQLDPAGAVDYRELLPVDGVRVEARDTVWTIRLSCDPIALNGRVHYRIGFTSDSGGRDDLTVVLRASDLLTAPDYRRWAVFLVKQWLTLPEPERKRQLSF